MIARIIDDQVSPQIVKWPQIELFEETVPAHDRILQLDAFDIFYRMHQYRTEGDAASQADDQNVVALRRQQQRHMAKERLRGQIVQGIHRAVLSERIQTG